MTRVGDSLSHTYQAFGLRLLSNLPIPGLHSSTEDSNPDIVCRLGKLPAWFRESDLRAQEEDGLVEVVGQDDAAVARRKLRQSRHYYYRYSDGTEFIFDFSGTRVFASWPPPLTLDDTLTYLLGPILGFILRLRGVLCLHASAVRIDGGAIAILGPAGAGKSTTAAALAMRGFAVLSDDVVALQEIPEGCFNVLPAHAHLRLWPASSRMLLGSESALPLLTPNWEKRYLDSTGAGYTFVERPTELSAVYVLEERRNDSSALSIETLNGGRALSQLVANTYGNNVLDEAMRRQEFISLSHLVRVAPVRKVIPHSDPKRLAELCDLIEADAKLLKVSRRAAASLRDGM